MKTLKLLVILALPFMAACVSNEKTPTPVVDENTIPAQPSGELIRAYVESNDFIDVDYKAIEYATINPTSSRAENVTEEEMAAAVSLIQGRLDWNNWTEAEVAKEGEKTLES